MLDRPSIRRMIEDMIRAEVASAAGGPSRALPPGPWPDDLSMDVDGLGSDSLERLTLAAAVNATFHIHETGTEEFLLARRRFGAWVDLVQQSRRLHGERISFFTSGSTGKAKCCTHAMADLWAEAEAHAARLRPSRILSAVPSHHIYGFIFSVLLPLKAGCEVTDIRAGLPSAFRPGDVIVSFPDHWRFLSRSLASLPAVTGVTSTAPMPGDLAHGLRAQGLSRLVEIYGSTETAGMGWRDDPTGPFGLLDGWSVADAPATEGTLSLAAPDGRRVETPDVVAMAGARSFHVRRRLDGAVQVGGVNVFPVHVEATLQRHPLVARARVRQASLESGGRLKALIEPKDPSADPDDLRRALEAWASGRLSIHEKPQSFTIASSLPSGPLGKACDWVEAI